MTHSIDMRVLDINKITSLAKQWLYGDLLLKPGEVVLYRSRLSGGLGLHNVKMKALAKLIKTFLETSCNCNFRHSLFHELLYRYHILDDKSITDPGLTPYYNKEFFKIIKQVHNNSPLDVAAMTEAQWYLLLVEDKVTMTMLFLIVTRALLLSTQGTEGLMVRFLRSGSWKARMMLITVIF